jgi:hypothetical protein
MSNVRLHMEPVDVDITDYQQMVELFHGESDRGAAVLAGSYVENYLAVYLKSRMADPSLADKIFAANGPLATLSQRIDFAQGFGFLPGGVCAELHTIRKIRNYFAHHPKSASFEQSPVRDWAGNFGTAKEVALQNGEKFKVDSLKTAYLIAAGLFVVMAYNLMHRPSSSEA